MIDEDDLSTEDLEILVNLLDQVTVDGLDTTSLREWAKLELEGRRADKEWDAAEQRWL